ncbi:MAG TPA: hypothetical protein VGC39_02030 [Candidatus Methylacidiphilales bacterium]
MRGIWRMFAFAAFLLVSRADGASGFSQLVGQVPFPDYDAICAHSQPGLQLTLTLPKDHFFQGEIVNATLTYSNSGMNPYTVSLARGDRSGRLMDVHFFGKGAGGAVVEDPIGWIYMQVLFGGGPVQLKELKDGTTATISLPINQWLRFDHPGTYTIFADTTTVHAGTGEAAGPLGSPQLVSNRVTITITPLPADEEKKIITDAMQRIDAGYHREDSPNLSASVNEENAEHSAFAVQPDIEILRYLQTPAARAALRSRLDKTPEFMIGGGHFQIAAALLGAPDRPAEAGLILDEVRAGRLKVDSGLIGLYAELKTYPETVACFSPTSSIRDENERDRARVEAQNEILAAAKQASSQTGVTNLDLIWEAFLVNPSDPAYRAPAIAHQLDFSHERQLRLLDLVASLTCRRQSPGEKDTSADFLPLVRLYLGPPAYDCKALMILSYARPDEAHDIVLADWASPQHHYFNNDGPLGQLAVTLLENPKIKWTDEQKSILDRMRGGH